MNTRTLLRPALTLASLFAVSAAALAAGADLGQAEKQATNWHAIIMFCIYQYAWNLSALLQYNLFLLTLVFYLFIQKI